MNTKAPVTRGTAYRTDYRVASVIYEMIRLKMNYNTVDSRLSYIDNEMLVLDSETQEIDRQAAILDRRIRYKYVYFISCI